MDHQRILCAEDRPADVELMLGIGAGRGPGEAVVVAHDGKDALNHPRPRAAHAVSPVRTHPGSQALPAIVLTSPKAAAGLCRCYDLGANVRVPAPAGKAGFRAVLESLSAFWLRLNEPPPPTPALMP